MKKMQQSGRPSVAAALVAGDVDSNCAPEIRSRILKDFNQGEPAHLLSLIPKMKTFDWRQYDIIAEFPRDQDASNCSMGCWVFASVSAFESCFLFTSGAFSGEAPLSIGVGSDVERVLGCAERRNRRKNCERGGWHGDALDTIFDIGLPVIQLHPVPGQPTERNTNPCAEVRPRPASWGYVIPSPNGVVSAEIPDDKEIKEHLIKFGPLVASMLRDTSFAEFTREKARETDGLFTGTSTLNSVNHVVLIIGWDNDKDAWIIQNSYGRAWGINGFALVKRRTNRIGQYAVWIEAERRSQ
jgi:cathepsin L